MAKVRVKVRVSGLEATIERLREIGGSLTPRILTGICARSLEPILETAKSTAHVGDPDTRKPGTVTIKESIRIRPLRSNELRRRGIVAGAMVGASSPKAHLIEYGTAPRTRRVNTSRGDRRNTTRVSTGQVTPKPFMRPAYEQNEEKVQTLAQQELKKALERRIRKVSRGGKK